MYGYKVATLHLLCCCWRGRLQAAGCRSVLHKTFKSSQDAAKHAHWDRLGQAGRAGRGKGRNSKFEWQRLAAAKPKTGCALWQQTRLPCCGELAESSRNVTVWQSAPQSVYACFDFALLSAAIWFVPPSAARSLGQHTSQMWQVPAQHASSPESS